MAAEAGINIKVNDDGTVNLQKFEKQVDSTFNTTKKSSGGIIQGFNKTTRAISNSIRSVGQLTISLLFGYKALHIFLKSDLFDKIKAGALGVASAFGKTGVATRALTPIFLKVSAASSKMALALKGAAAVVVGKFGVLKAFLAPVFGAIAIGIAKLKGGFLTLIAPVVRLAKYFLTSTVAGRALAAGIKKIAVAVRGLWASLKGSATFQKFFGGMNKRFSGISSSLSNTKKKSTSFFSSFSKGAKNTGKQSKTMSEGISLLGPSYTNTGKKGTFFYNVLAKGNKLFAAFITAGPLVQAALIGAAGAFVALTAAAVKFGKAALEVGRQNELFTIQYKTLYGTLEKADEKFKLVRKITASTPFQLDQMIALNAQLKTVTGGMLDNAEGLQMIADAAAATNNPLEEVGRNVGRVLAGFKNNVAVGAELMRLTEIGLISGETRAQLTEMIAKNASAEEKIKLVTKALKQYKGGAAAMALTLTGVTSNIKDMNREILSQTGDEMVEPVTFLKKTWLEFITVLQKTQVFKAVGVVFAAVINVISAAIAIILDPIKILLNAFVTLVGRIKALIAPINGLTGGAGKLGKLWGAWIKSFLTLKPLLFGVKASFWAIGQAIEFMQKTVFGLYKKFGQFVTSFKPVRAFFSWFDGILGKIAGMFEKVARAIDKFGTKIGAGALFGTKEGGKEKLDLIDFTGIQSRTDELIKGLKEMTEKEQIIAKYQEQRKQATADIDKAKAKLKDSDFLASSKLELELRKRLSAISVAQQRELSKLEAAKNKAEKEALESRLTKTKETMASVKSLYENLFPKDEKSNILKQQQEWIKEITNLNDKNKKAVDKVFGGLNKALANIGTHTDAALKTLDAKIAQEQKRLQEERTQTEISRAEQEAQRIQGYARTIEDSLKTNLEKQLGAGLISEDKYNKAVGFAETRKAQEGLVEAATALNVLKSQIGESGIQGMFGASTEQIMQKMEDNLTLENQILEQRKKNLAKENLMYEAIDGLNTLTQGIGTFKDIMAGNLAQGLGSLGDLVGNTMTRFLGATGPWGELLGTGLGFIGSLIGGDDKDRQEQMKIFQEIQRNTAKANQYLSSVDRNMSRLANRMEDLFILPDSAYYGSNYSLPEILDNEIAVGTQ